MTPWFVLSYPRSRTAWLSVCLTGAGVPCFHEAWKQVSTAKEMRALMEAQGRPVVCNSDCVNIFFMPELMAEFPEAQYILIENDEDSVRESLFTSYGDADYSWMFDQYRAAFGSLCRHNLRGVTLNCSEWGTFETVWLYQKMTGREIDAQWLAQVSGMDVQLRPEQIAADRVKADRGGLAHIATAMRRGAWV